MQPYQFPFARYPAVRILLLMVTGILVAHNWPLTVAPFLTAFLSVSILHLFFHFRSGTSLRPHYYFMGLSTYLLAIFLFGACWYLLTNKSSGDEPLYKALLNTYTWEQLQFRGEVWQIRQSGTGTCQVDLDISETGLPDSLHLSETYALRALLPPEKFPACEKLKLGNIITFRATLYPLDEKRNPRQFNYKQYLQSMGIYHQAGIDTVISITAGDRTFSWNCLRQSTLELIEHNFDVQTAPLAKALLIGYKQELSYEQKNAFSRVGLSHIMAVSGLHVGFLLAPFWLLIPFFWTWRYGRQAGLLLLILLLFFYAGITGFSASVTRASITGGFIMYAKLFNKIRDTINLTAVAAILILLINPEELFEIGFQLSFGAVSIILLTIPIASQVIPIRIRYRWHGKLIMILMVSFFVQLGLFPILSYYFGEFSLIGPLANVMVVPFLGILLPYALLLLPLATVSAETAAFLNQPVHHFLYALQTFVEETAAWEASWIQTSQPEPLLFLVWMVTIFLISSLQIPALRWKLGILLLMLLSFRQGSAVVQKFSTIPLTLTVFDVGQGDAILLKTPAGRHALIDAGRWSPGYNSGKHVLIPHLRAEGIEKLEAVFLSHPHADHIGGIVDLIETVPIDTIYNSGYPYDSRLFQTYRDLAQEKDIPILSLKAGQQVRLDPALRIFVYGPEQIYHATDPNEHSLILEIHYGTTEFLFMGDAGTEQEQRLLENYGGLLDTDLLKAGHHGSKTSSSLPFLKVASPEHTVISLAKSNKFRHPHREAIKRLRTTDSMLHFTSLEGALIFTSDGERIRRLHWK